MPTSLKHTDPTYLRTIHDGLLSGAVHKDNVSALPQGLVGMYEEALPPASNVNERKKFLEFFAVWALLKKEVSALLILLLSVYQSRCGQTEWWRCHKHFQVKDAIVHLLNQRDEKKESWISFSTGRIMRPEISEL